MLLAAVCLATSLAGCKKDKKSSGDIVGKWTIVTIGYADFENGQLERDAEDADPGSFIEFKSDGTYALGVVVTQESGTWTKSGNELTFTEGSDVTKATIEKLTSSDLVFKIREVDGNDYSETIFYATT